MNQDHVFIDLAVSNPNPRIGHIVGVAAVRTDKKGKVLAAFSEAVAPPSDSRNHRGCVVNAEPFNEVAAGLKAEILSPRFQPNYVVISCGADVDKTFLDEANGTAFFHRRAWIDALHLAWPLAFNDMVTERSLEALCALFEIPITHNKRGTAMGDCEALVRVYWEMMARYRAALLGEEAVRALGGETLKKARQFFGW